jgi:hypothetical protein
MSVAVAITVTFPNYTAAGVVATGTDVAQTLGADVARLIRHKVIDGKVSGAEGTVTWSATVT